MACFHVWCGFEGRYCDECAIAQERVINAVLERYDGNTGGNPKERSALIARLKADHVMKGKTCTDLVREVRDYNRIRADEKARVGENNREEMLIVKVLDRIIEASATPSQRLDAATVEREGE